LRLEQRRYGVGNLDWSIVTERLVSTLDDVHRSEPIAGSDQQRLLAADCVREVLNLTTKRLNLVVTVSEGHPLAVSVIESARSFPSYRYTPQSSGYIEKTIFLPSHTPRKLDVAEHPTDASRKEEHSVFDL
jgi:hypothetical protein